MKVTVCFGAVRVLVPCGAGDLLVRDLVREATLRYKKATGQYCEEAIKLADAHVFARMTDDDEFKSVQRCVKIILLHLLHTIVKDYEKPLYKTEPQSLAAVKL
ncbi:unnamed protein product [Pieris macdunnoughi]|uniref:Par3/HAL N-terminal domain-containing protein n=1 Tax=Pieris macdunnoughi TaxID=345717 RepID=A0A821X6U1_9NEOP|nr:unnamed protein product [Pieris macdunnoughi]